MARQRRGQSSSQVRIIQRTAAIIPCFQERYSKESLDRYPCSWIARCRGSLQSEAFPLIASTIGSAVIPRAHTSSFQGGKWRAVGPHLSR